MSNWLVYLLRRNTHVIAYFLRRTRNTDKVLRDLQGRTGRAQPLTRKRRPAAESGAEALAKPVQSKEARQKSHLASQRLKFKNEERAGKYFKENPGATRFLSESEIAKRIYKSQQLNDLLNLYHAHKFTFSVNNLVSLTTRYASLFVQNMNKVRIYKKDKRLQTLLFNLEQNLSFFSPEEKILLLWSLAKINMVSDLCELIVNDTLQKIDKIRFKYISLFAWTLAITKQRNSQVFARISNHICPLIGQAEIVCEPTKGPSAKPALPEQEEEGSDDFEEELPSEDSSDSNKEPLINERIEMRSLCLLIWSFGKSNMLDEDLFGLFCKKILEKGLIPLMPFKSISAVLYAFSKVNFFEKKSKDLMLGQVIHREKSLPEESILTLKTLLVLAAKEKNQEPQVKRAILMMLAKAIIARQKEKPLSAKFLSEIVWWLSVCNFKEDNIISNLEHNVRRVITEMNGRDLTYCFFAFAKYFKIEIEKKKNPYREILDILSERILEMKRSLDKRSLGMIKESFEASGYLHHSYKELFKNSI